MKAELYVNKASMQMKKGDIEGAVCLSNENVSKRAPKK